MTAHDRRIVAERAAEAGAEVAETAFRRQLDVATKSTAASSPTPTGTPSGQTRSDSTPSTTTKRPM